jgi:transposase
MSQLPQFKHYAQNQPMLLPPDLRDWVPPDHACHVINDIIEKLDTSCIEETYSKNGASAYYPKMLLKVIFYCYTQGIRSSRKIENATKENVACRYLAADQHPDHGTINLFRKDHLANLEELFAQIVILGDGLNIIDPEDFSIDGTIMKANASKKKTYSAKEIAKLKKKIREILHDAERIDAEEDKKFGNKRGYNQLPDKLKDPETRQKEIERLQKKMEQLSNAEEAIKEKQAQAKTSKEKKLNRNNNHNITDEDAKLMKMKNGKAYQPSYNGQISASKQFILAYNVTDDGNDAKQLIPMIEKTEKNTGKKAKKTKADSIYFSKDNMDKIEEKEIDAYIPDTMKSIEEKQERDNTVPKYDRRNFKHDQKKNELVCPRNKRLRHLETSKGVSKYVCSDCGGCPAKTKCTKGKNRQVYINWQLEAYKTKMRKKLNSELGKNKYLERMSEVEAPFGNIIYNQQAGNFLCRGGPMVNIEFGLSCSAHNLVKIVNWSKKNENKAQFNTLMRLPATPGSQT